MRNWKWFVTNWWQKAMKTYLLLSQISQWVIQSNVVIRYIIVQNRRILAGLVQEWKSRNQFQWQKIGYNQIKYSSRKLTSNPKQGLDWIYHYANNKILYSLVQEWVHKHFQWLLIHQQKYITDINFKSPHKLHINIRSTSLLTYMTQWPWKSM